MIEMNKLQDFFLRNNGDKALEKKNRLKQVKVRIFPDSANGKRSLCGN